MEGRSMSKIYLIERTDDVDYDEYDSVAVVANSPKEAEEYVLSADNYLSGFHTDHNFTVKAVGVYKRHLNKPKGLISSFNAG
jgi:hypothetical protein